MSNIKIREINVTFKINQIDLLGSGIFLIVKKIEIVDGIFYGRSLVMEQDRESSQSTGIKRWLGIFLAVVLLLAGLYIYYIYFYSNESMALINPEIQDELNILIIGWGNEDEDLEMRNKKADAIVLLKLDTKDNKLTFNSVPSYSQLNGNPVKTYEVDYIQEKVSEANKFKDEPNYYFTINYQGFKKIVNELSGVEVELNEPLRIPDLGLYLEEGTNLLSGNEALNYVRWYEEDTDDRKRARRQYDIIKGVLDKILQKNTLLNVPKLYSTLVNTMEAVDTNLDKELVTAIFNFLRNRDEIEIEHRVVDIEYLN